MIKRLVNGAVGGVLAGGLIAACAMEAASASSLASALLSTISSAAPAVAQPVTHDSEVWCDIRITRTRAGLRFDPVAEATAHRDVSYRFTLTRIDRNGSSDMEQGGDVSLAPFERVTLSSSDFSIDRGGRYRAWLVLEGRHGVICRQEARS